jgi:hypothetical protein
MLSAIWSPVGSRVLGITARDSARDIGRGPLNGAHSGTADQGVLGDPRQDAAFTGQERYSDSAGSASQGPLPWPLRRG